MKHLLPLLLVTGCVIGANSSPRPSELEPDWFVDRPRVLAVRADPPEARPGDLVTFSALIPQPGVDPYAVIWLACPPVDDSGSGFGCSIPADLDLEGATPAELAALGLIGFEPGLPPAYTVPADALEGLSDADRLEGSYTLIQVSALPQAYLDPETAPDEIDFNDVEAAYKRLVVSDAPTPNQNPEILAFTVDGLRVPNDAVLHVDSGQTYELGALIPASSIESYSFVNSEGVTEERTEEPYLAWFATGGDLLESVTLVPYVEASWVAPAAGETGTVWAVLRDRRGGMSWIAQDWVAE